MAGISAAPRVHNLVATGMALVPEGRLIFTPFTVRDNLRLGAIALSRRGSLAERHDYVFGLFPRLAERAGQRAGTLSGGEQQMLAIGRALMSRPTMLLLDEPFLGLAPMIVNEIVAALRKLQRDGLTILLVEQKLDIALTCTTRAYVMLKGALVLEKLNPRPRAAPGPARSLLQIVRTGRAASLGFVGWVRRN